MRTEGVHIPVLLEDVLVMTDGMCREPKKMLDGTFGRGGHSSALLSQHPGLQICGLDQDLAAVEYAKVHFQKEIEQQKIQIVHGSFHRIKDLIPEFGIEATPCFDLILLDLGVSSPQLDEGHRGFSFQQTGPLDMRMNQNQSLRASDIVNTWSEQELKDLFFHVGEVRRPGRVVNELIKRRKEKPFETTTQLADLIASVEGWRKKGFHPATQYFLALRIEVNQELEPLAEALNDMIDILNEGGRLLVITFHSLEDRIAKHVLKGAKEKGRLLNKKVIQASWAEKKENARARSAKLRGYEKGGAHEQKS